MNNVDNSKLTPKKDYVTKNFNVFKDYKFVVCFENSFFEEYITDKLVSPMLANRIPVYRGAQNVSQYFNKKAFINYEDYDCSHKKMIKKIIELDNDDEKYRHFLEEPWMTEQNLNFIEEKVQKLEIFIKNIFDKI